MRYFRGRTTTALLILIALVVLTSLILPVARYIKPVIFLLGATYETVVGCREGLDFYHEHYEMEAAGIRCFDSLDESHETTWTILKPEII